MLHPRFTELLSKEISGTISDPEKAELTSLLEQNPTLRRENELLKVYLSQPQSGFSDAPTVFGKVMQKITLAEAAAAEAERTSLPALPEKRPIALYRRINAWQKLAAIFVFGLFVYGSYAWFSRRESENSRPALSWQIKTTPRGTRSTLVLSDGSRITLNAASELKYPAVFKGAQREVYLTGEAFFDVHKDASHPFIIHTAKMNVRVLGTEFNVRSYPDDSVMETTLIRGSVEVTFPSRPADRVILKPKDKLVVPNTPRPRPEIQEKDSAGGKMTEVKSDATQYLLTGITYARRDDSTIVETSWLDNKLIFRNEDFETLARRMERWYGVSIVFDNKAAAAFRFTGLFQKESIREAFYALQLTEDFTYSIDGTNIRIR